MKDGKKFWEEWTTIASLKAFSSFNGDINGIHKSIIL
jgi:hypothetical protein